MKYSIAIGTESERLAALKADADITIINREQVDWLVNKSKVPFEWDACIIDEVSSFKNSSSKRFKAFMKVRPNFKRVIALTGTPSSNGLEDLYAEFKLLDYGERLGRFLGQFRNAFFRPAVMNGPVVYKYAPLPGAEEEGRFVVTMLDEIIVTAQQQTFQRLWWQVIVDSFIGIRMECRK